VDAGVPINCAQKLSFVMGSTEQLGSSIEFNTEAILIFHTKAAHKYKASTK